MRCGVEMSCERVRQEIPGAATLVLTSVRVRQ